LLGSDLETDSEEHLLLGNRFLISRYAQLLLCDIFAVRHVPMAMIGATMEELCLLRGLCQGILSETGLELG
jgi:hypothetical protein